MGKAVRAALVIVAVGLLAAPAPSVVEAQNAVRTVSIRVVMGRHHDILAAGLDDYVYQGRGIYELEQLGSPPRLRITGVGLGESTLLLRFTDGRRAQYRITVVNR